MKQGLQSYINEVALARVLTLLEYDNLNVLIKKERKTRHGDYRQLSNGQHQITINSNLNEFRFLITLIHEIAHYEAYKKYGKHIKPHGKEWKLTFKYLMLPFLNPQVFPSNLLPHIANHFKNPKASSDTDTKLALALKKYDLPNDNVYVFEVPLGNRFRMYNGRVFVRGNKKVKRYECIEVKTGKRYLFNPNAEVKNVSLKEEIE